MNIDIMKQGITLLIYMLIQENQTKTNINLVKLQALAFGLQEIVINAMLLFQESKDMHLLVEKLKSLIES